jgi:hypothetical protein
MDLGEEYSRNLQSIIPHRGSAQQLVELLPQMRGVVRGLVGEIDTDFFVAAGNI